MKEERGVEVKLGTIWGKRSAANSGCCTSGETVTGIHQLGGCIVFISNLKEILTF
jgi:hypothetical protein